MASLKERLTADVKAAMLARDNTRLETLRGLKSVILYAEVAAGSRDSGGLNDAEIQALFAKEAKKRQESADLYIQGGSQEKADKELTEKRIIEEYLPKQMSGEELGVVIDQIIDEVKPTGPQQMGQVISAVKERVGVAADGSLVARLVKERLQ